MATRTTLAAVLNGLVRNVDLTADELVLDSVTLGGGSGTNLTKTILDSLISNSHASGSDNQNVVAGNGLTGGGSGSTVTLDVGAGDGITVNADDIAVNNTVVRTNGANAFSADQSMGGNKLTNLANPTSATDAANKQYVDSLSAGLDPKESVRAATTAALPASTYDNGASGVGATLTANSNGALPAQDGITLTTNDRLLVKNQASALENGIYIVTDLGDGSNPFVLTRALDQDGSPSNEVSGGNFTFVEQGTAQEGSGWVVVFDGDIAVGTDDIVWTQFSETGTSAVISVNGQTGVVVLDTDDISEGASNFYYTESRFNTSFAGKDTDDLSEGATNFYYTEGRFDTSFAGKDTGDLAEGSNLYFTDERAQDAVGNILVDSSTIDFTYNDGTPSITADVISSPMSKKTMVAGESFAANTSFLVRFAVNGETAGRVYKADCSNGAADGKFWAIGMALSTGAVSAGQNIDVVLLGTHTLGSSDTPFSGTDVGKAVWLTTSGAFSVTAPTSTAEADFKVGVIEDTNKVFIDGKQLTGINA